MRTWCTLLEVAVAKISHFCECHDREKKKGILVVMLSYYFFCTYFYSHLFHFPYRKCQKILGKNTELWEFEVYKFKEIGQLKVSSFLCLHSSNLYVVLTVCIDQVSKAPHLRALF